MTRTDPLLPDDAALVEQCDRDAAAEYMRRFPDLRLSEAFARHRILAALTRSTATNCPSCGGLNTSCPDGCGRDPETGELNGTRLTRSTVTTPPAKASEAQPSAYLKFWWNDGKRCCRVDLTETCEPWLHYLKPDIVPLYPLAAQENPDA